MSGLLVALRARLRRRGVVGALIGMALIGGLSVYAVYGLLRSDVSGQSLQAIVAHIGVGMLLSATLVYICDLALALLGWSLIMGTLSGVWDWVQHVRIYCISAITRRLPGTMWYMLGRVVLYERLQVARSLTLIASGIEFAAIIMGGLLVVIVTWPIALSGQALDPIWLGAGLLAGCALLNPPMLRWLIRRVSPQSRGLDLRYRHLLGWMLLYALVWCVGGGIVFVLATALHPLPLTRLPAIIGIWATSGLVSMLFSFVPFGLGVQELTLSALLSTQITRPEAIVVALLMRAVLTVNEALWALIAALVGLLPGGGLPRVLIAERSAPDRPLPHSEGMHPEEVYEPIRVIPQK